MIKIPYYETSHFVLSNFSPHTVRYNATLFPTVEHAYHAAKFENKDIVDKIKNAGSPLEAHSLGKKYKPQRRKDWNDVKVDILHEIIQAKVEQHEEVKQALLATSEEEIIEENPNNSFWGNGKDGKGQNQMGKILMRIREDLSKH